MSQGVCGHSNEAGQSEWALFSTDQSPVNIDELDRLLKDRVVAHKKLLGSYKGVKEISYLVKAGQVEDIIALGYLQGQESYLLLDPCNARGLRKTWLVQVSTGERTELDYFGSYSSTIPENEDYTFDPVTGCVYTIRPYVSATSKPLSKIPKKVQESYAEYHKSLAG